MANWIDASYVNNFLSSEVRAELFTDESGTPDITVLIGAAQSKVEAALRFAGYEIPATTTNNDLKLAVLGQFLPLAYARPSKGLEVPEEYDSFVALADDIRAGELQPKGLTPSAIGAVGGIEFTESDPDVDGASTQFSTRDDLAGF